MSTLIHSTAIIERGAELDSGVKVGAFAYIGTDVRLHKNVSVGHYALIEGHTTIGADTQVYAHAKVGVTPQDLKFKGEPGCLVLGEGNRIRESASIEFGTEGGGMETRLGDNNLLMINAHIAHDGQVGDDVVIGMCAGAAGHVTIGSGVRIASLAGIHQFVRIGDMSYIGLSAIVNRDVLPYSLIDQNNECIGQNLVGMRRSGMENSAIKEVQQILDHLYDTVHGNFEQRLSELLLQETSSPEAKVVLDFAQAKSRQALLMPPAK
ncbi:MAG: acyl-ACP--UDP-N-acetylglucosamine O-acyltransferase [Alphaproteobacteria bacterium]|nr:acyl-ACP--UDP-N-acetylglucosamine O-acyltransferase [Alphaproteobacteria bacterium]